MSFCHAPDIGAKRQATATCSGRTDQRLEISCVPTDLDENTIVTRLCSTMYTSLVLRLKQAPSIPLMLKYSPTTPATVPDLAILDAEDSIAGRNSKHAVRRFHWYGC
jgi:hypothetical protein